MIEQDERLRVLGDGGAERAAALAGPRLGVDAAILFADILLILEPMGVGLEYSKGDGPVIHHPVRSGKDVDGLKDFDVATDASPDEVRALFRNCRLIGRRFRLAHVRFGPHVIEVATFRAAHDPEIGRAHV